MPGVGAIGSSVETATDQAPAEARASDNARQSVISDRQPWSIVGLPVVCLVVCLVVCIVVCFVVWVTNGME